MSATPEPISDTPPHRVLRPFMRQSWRELTFLHWFYEPSIIRPLIPNGLRLDSYNGRAWVGLVPFVVADLTMPNAPAIPWVSTFPETNVRTYVIGPQGQRGVWFFSLDAARLLAVIGARAGYALPYFWARMNVACDGTTAQYSSRRHFGLDGRSQIEVRIGEEIRHPTELDVFLTARFRLYARRGNRLLKADVEHRPWQLRRADVVQLNETLIEAAGLPAPRSEPIVHFGGSVDVRVSVPEEVFTCSALADLSSPRLSMVGCGDTCLDISFGSYNLSRQRSTSR
jgi:uncharacterized protein